MTTHALTIQPPATRGTVTISLRHSGGAEDGKPVQVTITRLGPYKVAEIQGQLSGGVPAQSSAKVDPRQALENAFEWILAGCVEPQFTRANELTDGKIPLDWLGQEDIAGLLSGIMKLSGVGSGSFRESQ